MSSNSPGTHETITKMSDYYYYMLKNDPEYKHINFKDSSLYKTEEDYTDMITMQTELKNIINNKNNDGDKLLGIISDMVTFYSQIGTIGGNLFILTILDNIINNKSNNKRKMITSMNNNNFDTRRRILLVGHIVDCCSLQSYSNPNQTNKTNKNKNRKEQ